MNKKYDLFISVINQRNYDFSDMLKKIEQYHIAGDISDDEKEELVNKARLNADVKNGVDLFEKLAELEARVKALEEGKTDEGETEAYPEYVAGKWYYRGDKCSENGKNYTCIAPESVVCTWSPSEYPAYWEEEV
jgi:hypothetical protein